MPIKALGRSRLVAGKESVVVLVVSDPEPDDSIALKHADCSVVAGDANGVDRPGLAHALELQARVSWVAGEDPVPFTGLVLDLPRKLAKQVPEPGVRLRLHIFSGSMGVVRPASASATASSASAFRGSWDRANRWVHPCSLSSSDRSHPAMRSWSSAGSDDSCEKTLSSARVMEQPYRGGDCRTSRCSRQSRRRGIV